MQEIVISKGYIAGSIERVVELHSDYYSKHWGFNSFFECKVATELAEFISRYDDDRDGFWTVSLEGSIEGSITVDGINIKSGEAHLRWFIVSEACQGRGIGGLLIDTAINFCRSRGYRRIYLYTFAGLDAASHIYQKHGFQILEQHTGNTWGTPVNEQLLELWLKE
jgi:ribosomal protein S18 acetylase RimI-like enzyme